MTGIIRTLALGAVLVAGAATGAMAQGINNTGYDRSYYGDPGYGTYYGKTNPSGRYYGPGDRDYSGYSGYYGYRPVPPYAGRYDYYGNTYGYGGGYGSGWGAGPYGSGNPNDRFWGSGGGSAYDRGYDGSYWGR